MTEKRLLHKYFTAGWLSKSYYSDEGYRQLYSAEDRLLAGNYLREDFLKWNLKNVKVQDYSVPKVDGGSIAEDIHISLAAERFRQAIKQISPMLLPVVYKIVFEEKEIRPPYSMSTREKLYFYDEIKTLLCRGLDEAVRYYRRC